MPSFVYPCWRQSIACRLSSTHGSPPSKYCEAQIGGDMSHQFRSGQTVRLCRGLPYRSAADGDYKIVRQLPDNGGEQQYRIKSMREPHDRVVKESDLEKA
jgi:hypothetical protein